MNLLTRMLISRAGIVIDKWGFSATNYLVIYLRCECVFSEGGSIFDVTHSIKYFDVKSASGFSRYDSVADNVYAEKKYMEQIRGIKVVKPVKLNVASSGEVITIELYIYIYLYV